MNTRVLAWIVLLVPFVSSCVGVSPGDPVYIGSLNKPLFENVTISGLGFRDERISGRSVGTGYSTTNANVYGSRGGSAYGNASTATVNTAVNFESYDNFELQGALRRALEDARFTRRVLPESRVRIDGVVTNVGVSTGWGRITTNFLSCVTLLVLFGAPIRGASEASVELRVYVDDESVGKYVGHGEAYWRAYYGLIYTMPEGRAKTRVMAAHTALQAAVAQMIANPPNLSEIVQNENLGATTPETITINTGTGWPVAEGYIVTSHHVVAGRKMLTVQIDGEEHRARLVAKDAANDLALLQIDDVRKLPPALRLASSPARLGTRVFTLGFPFLGVLGVTPKLTSGEVSATTGIGDEPNAYQVSVPIHPGNSGGPLLDLGGNVVGIVSYKLNEDAIGVPVENVNFAIKSEYLRALLTTVPILASVPSATRNGDGLEATADSVLPSIVLVIAR